MLPDDVRVLDIFGAEYLIEWDDLPRGGSFFLPTTATAEQVTRLLRPIQKLLNYRLTVRQRCEFGRYGVRVWRTY